jgi:hypothetical protein
LIIWAASRTCSPVTASSPLAMTMSCRAALPVGEAVLDRDGRWRVALYSRAAPVDLVWIWPFSRSCRPKRIPSRLKPILAAKGPPLPVDGARRGGRQAAALAETRERLMRARL